MSSLKSANFSPIYCALYPELAEICRSHGYALAVHGSMARDFDLICIPWIEKPSSHREVIQSIEMKYAIKEIGNSEQKEHGRIAYTLSIAFGDCFIDLSFMPCLSGVACN